MQRGQGNWWSRRPHTPETVRSIRTPATILAMVIALLFAGCGTTKDVFTNPTGRITIERQQFINTWALVKVIWKHQRSAAELACVQAPTGEVGSCFAKLREIDDQAKALSFQVEAKLATPESEIDWAVVIGLLKAIVSLVP